MLLCVCVLLACLVFGRASLIELVLCNWGNWVLGLTSLYMTKMISDNYNRVANSS